MLIDPGDDPAEAPRETAATAPAATDDVEQVADSAPAPGQTPSPEPQPGSEPGPEPIPTFTAVVIEGRGDDVVDVRVVTDAPLVVTLTHSGTSNGAVVSYGESGQRLDRLVNEIGPDRGTARLPGAIALEIKADGDWTLSE